MFYWNYVEFEQLVSFLQFAECSTVKFSEIINLFCWSDYKDIKNKREIYRFEKMPRIVDKLGREINDKREEDELLLEFLYETGSEMYSYKDWELINREYDRKLHIENVIRFL